MDQKSLTPTDVRDALFDKAPFGRRGYHEDQVDAFLDRIEATLNGTDRLTAQEVRAVVFRDAPLRKRGYHEDQVDAFLDTVAETLELRERVAETPPPPAPAEQTAPILFTRPPSLPAGAPVDHPDSLDDPKGFGDDLDTAAPLPAQDGLLALPIPPPPPGTRGYRPGDVERLARLLVSAVAEVGGPTSEDLRTARLSRTFFNGQGYHTEVVDTLRNAWIQELRHREE